MVAIEQSEEASLCASGALDTTEADVIAGALQVAQIPEQLLLIPFYVNDQPPGDTFDPYLEPQGRTLADSGELCRLEVSESKSTLR